MSLIRIAKTRSKRAASVEKINLDVGFTKHPYFRWVLDSFQNVLISGTLLKKAGWHGGLDIISPNKKQVAALGVANYLKDDQGFWLFDEVLERNRKPGFAIIPVDEMEFEDIQKGGVLRLSYPEVIWCAVDKQSALKLVSAYMKKAGRRETKYLVYHETMLAGVAGLSSICWQLGDFLTCVGGYNSGLDPRARFFCPKKNNKKPALMELQKEADEMLSKLRQLPRAFLNSYSVYLPSILSRGVTISGKAAMGAVSSEMGCHYIDVSRGTFEFKRFE